MLGERLRGRRMYLLQHEGHNKVDSSNDLYEEIFTRGFSKQNQNPEKG